MVPVNVCVSGDPLMPQDAGGHAPVLDRAPGPDAANIVECMAPARVVAELCGPALSVCVGPAIVSKPWSHEFSQHRSGIFDWCTTS